MEIYEFLPSWAEDLVAPDEAGEAAEGVKRVNCSEHQLLAAVLAICLWPGQPQAFGQLTLGGWLHGLCDGRGCLRCLDIRSSNGAPQCVLGGRRVHA